MKNIFSFLLIIFIAIAFIACDDDDSIMPISKGVSVTINNTLQSQAFGIPEETAIEEIFSVPEGSLFATAVVGDGLEFDDYLLTLYDIDIDESSITFTLVAPEDSETYSNNFRTIEAGTFDRYYFNFDTSQNVSSFTSNNSSVSLRIDSSTRLVVEITEGFDFNPGTTFTINLN